MDGKQLWAKLRPTAVVFAFFMGVLAWLLIHYVLSGPLGSTAFGDGQAVAVVTAALLVVGAAVNSLGNALLKLSEDAPPEPPPRVPESSHQALIELIGIAWSQDPQTGQQLTVHEVDGHRPREGIGASGS